MHFIVKGKIIIINYNIYKIQCGFHIFFLLLFPIQSMQIFILIMTFWVPIDGYKEITWKLATEFFSRKGIFYKHWINPPVKPITWSEMGEIFFNKMTMSYFMICVELEYFVAFGIINILAIIWRSVGRLKEQKTGVQYFW